MMQQYQPGMDNKSQNLIQALEKRQYQTAVLLIKEIDITNQLFSRIKDIYSQTLITDQDQYQEWLHIISLPLAPKLSFKPYHEFIELIISQIVCHSSPKYLVIILRSLLHRLNNSMFAKYIILSCIHFLGSLLFDATVQDLIELYYQFNQVSNTLIVQAQQFAQYNQTKLQQIAMESKIRLIQVFYNFKYVVKHKYCQHAINLINEIVRDLLKIQDNHIDVEVMARKYQIKTNLKYIPKQFLDKFNIDLINYQPPILFTRCLLNKTSINQLSFDQSIYSPKTVTLLLIYTVNKTLTNSLSEPPQLIKLQYQFIHACIRYIADQLVKNSYSTFIIDHFIQIERLIERLNIYLGSINPHQELYKIVNNVFGNMTFLEARQKEKILANLIHKHDNLSFKGHLISLYRKLLNFKCCKAIVIKSTYLLFKELRRLEPKSSIDYISHILSFAFYWRHVTSKLKIQINLVANTQQLMNEYNEILVKLKKGLQLRAQLLQSQKHNEVQRNEIQVCIFRITQILNPNPN